MTLKVLQAQHCVHCVGATGMSQDLWPGDQPSTMDSLSCPLTPQGAPRVGWPKLPNSAHDFVCPLRVTLLAVRKQHRNKGIKDMNLGKQGLSGGDNSAGHIRQIFKSSMRLLCSILKLSLSGRGKNLSSSIKNLSYYYFSLQSPQFLWHQQFQGSGAHIY